jgi:signal transduction histidine kinase/CheY-like chemotaxis protein
MNLNINKTIRKSHYIRWLTSVTTAVAVFSCALYIPDIFLLNDNSNLFTENETIAHELTNLILSVCLGIVSLLSMGGFWIQRKFFSVLETLPYSVLMFSPNGKIFTANRLGRDILKILNCKTNLSYDEFITTICSFNLNNEISNYHNDSLILNAFESQKTLFQDIIYAPDGRIFFLQCQETKVGEKIILITDSTKIHKLNHEAQTLLHAVDLSPAAYALATINKEDLTLLYSNESFKQLTQKSFGNNLLHSNLKSLYPEKEWNELLNAISKQEPYKFETMIFDKQKISKWISCQIFPFIQNDQEMILICMNDRTEEKLKDSQMQQSARLETMGHLAGGIAHDFNNILSILQGYLKLSLKDHNSEEQQNDYKMQMQKAITRGTSLTKQLLSFGRNQVSSTGQTNINNHIKDMEGFMQTLIHSSANLKISVPQNETLNADCSPEILTQIIMNLTVNARDAMPQGGEILIAAHKISAEEKLALPIELQKNLSDFVCIQVIDSGTGIDPEHLPHIFDPFFTTKDIGKGTGLGLSLVYRHLQNLGGHISVLSIKDKGTNISVFLPLAVAKSDMTSAQAVSIPQNEDSLKGRIVLVAEDEPDLRMLFKDTLEEWGCIVYAGSNGAEALSLQDSLDHVDFLITDVMMPTMNGLRLAEIMQDLHPNCRTIFISGYPKGGDLAIVKIPEQALFLTKPIDDEILKKIMLNSSVPLNSKDTVHTWSIQKKGDMYDRKKL